LASSAIKYCCTLSVGNPREGNMVVAKNWANSVPYFANNEYCTFATSPNN